MKKTLPCMVFGRPVYEAVVNANGGFRLDENSFSLSVPLQHRSVMLVTSCPLSTVVVAVLKPVVCSFYAT